MVVISKTLVKIKVGLHLAKDLLRGLRGRFWIVLGAILKVLFVGVALFVFGAVGVLWIVVSEDVDSVSVDLGVGLSLEIREMVYLKASKSSCFWHFYHFCFVLKNGGLGVDFWVL